MPLKVSDIAKKLTQPGKHADGFGLYLFVRKSGHGSWVAQYRWQGETLWMTFGPQSIFSLDEARRKHVELRRKVYEGIDPCGTVAAGPAKTLGALFGTVLDDYLRAASPDWRGGVAGKEAVSFKRTFAQIPDFLKLEVSAITPQAIRDAVAFWADKPVTAKRMKTRIKTVAKFAVDGEIRSRKPVKEVEHHEAMPWADVPQFVADLTALGTVEARALQWTILSAARSGETLGATWSEIGEDEGLPVWIIPGSRMKAGRTHRVPLTPQMLALLGDRRDPEAFLFRGHLIREGGLRAEALRQALGALRPNGYTVHGFRSSFRDWTSEATDFDRILAEWSLAHAIGTKLERDYARSDLLVRRRELMSAWSKFCTATEGRRND